MSQQTLADRHAERKPRRMSVGIHEGCEIYDFNVKTTKNGNKLIEYWVRNKEGKVQQAPAIFFPRSEDQVRANLEEGQSLLEAVKDNKNEFLDKVTDMVLLVAPVSDLGKLGTPNDDKLAEAAWKLMSEYIEKGQLVNVVNHYDRDFEYTEIPRGGIERHVEGQPATFHVKKNKYRMTKPVYLGGDTTNTTGSSNDGTAPSDDLPF